MKLQGIVLETIHCELISSKELITLDSQDRIWCVLELKVVHSEQDKPSLSADIQTLVDQFVTLFMAPTSLSPKRASEHTIPLLPGAQ